MLAAVHAAARVPQLLLLLVNAQVELLLLLLHNSILNQLLQFTLLGGVAVISQLYGLLLLPLWGIVVVLVPLVLLLNRAKLVLYSVLWCGVILLLSLLQQLHAVVITTDALFRLFATAEPYNQWLLVLLLDIVVVEAWLTSPWLLLIFTVDISRVFSLALFLIVMLGVNTIGVVVGLSIIYHSNQIRLLLRPIDVVFHLMLLCYVGRDSNAGLRDVLVVFILLCAPLITFNI